MPASYVEVEVRANSPLPEELAGVLSQIGFEGFWEDGPVLKCYIGAGRWDNRMEEEVRRICRLMVRSSAEGFPRVSTRIIADENWNAAWEATIVPIRVTDRFVIAPSWHPHTPAGGDIVLTIDPKMSFGTGYHESTRLILRLIERFVVAGARMLDVGTGTGVLAIAAVKLGGASSIGLDTDEWAFANAKENVSLNGVGASVQILHGEIGSAPAEEFDIVAANIQRSIIEPILSDMLRRLKPGGTLLLSGLLLDDIDPITRILKTLSCSTLEVLRENEWAALAASRL